MRRFFEMARSSFGLAMQELWQNKLRTFLSLFGITIGIFCIIGVLTTVGSLERNLQDEIQSLGKNTIYVDKWQYSAGPDYPFWKYAKRPPPQYAELAEIKSRTPTVRYAAFKISVRADVEAAGAVASRINVYGVSEDFTNIQPLEIEYGRFISEDEFYRGSSVAVLGNALAESLFGNAALALGKSVVVQGQRSVVIGVLKKQGTQLIGGWGFDEAVILPYRYGRTLMDEQRADPLILVQAAKGATSKAMQDELEGTMRAVRKLRPAEEDNFSLNNVADFSATMSKVFVSVNLGGWIIGALAFAVGIFGVANIMFVTVTERTAQIGLKKALGAKSRLILTEFLSEAVFLCMTGGFIGLLLVFALTKLATAVLHFPVFLSPGIIALAIFICVTAGILAGFFPALKAARMNPVVAIRR